MSSEIGTIMASIATQLAAAYPDRVVSRKLRDFGDIAETDLEAGVYTLVAGPESNFANYRGREGNFGTLKPLIVAQVMVAEDDEAEDIEEAESLMIDEIKAFCRSQSAALAAPVDSLVPIAYTRSQQLERPYGWVSFQMELSTS